MRMRARIGRPDVFSRMAMSLEKLAKTWILRMTPTALHFIVADQELVDQSHIQVWGQIQANFVLEDYRVESNNNNEIWLVVNGEYLVRALKSTQNSIEVLIKLTKKDGWPLLSFNIIQQSRAERRIQVIQDVPVRVLSPQQQQAFHEPLVPEPQVHIMMPPLGSLKTISDRMKSLSSAVVIEANMAGEFVMKMDTDAVSVETRFEGLINPELDPTQVDLSQQPSMTRDPKAFASVRVDIKDFLKFLATHLVNPSNVVCCIIEGHGLVFYVYVGGAEGGMLGDDSNGEGGCSQYGALTYYLPVKML